MAKKICTILIISIMFAGGVCHCSAEEAIVAATEAQAAKQNGEAELRVIKSALLQGADDQTRDDAAGVLLHRSDADARAALIETLGLADNAEARKAVCRGLIKSREWSSEVVNVGQFIDPLLAMLTTAEGADAHLAGEALLIFPYYQVRDKLSKVVHGEGVDKKARLNGIYALGLRPGEKGAILELVELLGDEDKDIAAAAGSALPHWIPKGADRAAVVRDLDQKSPSEIIRDRMDYQRKEMRRLEAETDKWRQMYLKLLDKEYDEAVDADRGALLYEKLSVELGAVKLWALEKVSQRPAGVVLPQGFSDRLIGLLGDSDRLVRLKTANVLAIMSDLNPGVKLLEQLRVEKDDTVRLAVFEALGEACYYAFSPGSTIKLPDEIRLETLKEAGEYVKQADAVKAKMGAEVIRKMLEPNGLLAEVKDVNLSLVAERYSREKGKGSVLEGELIGIMAKLCDQQGNRGKAGKLFRQAFIEGLDAKSIDAVREGAVIGLVNIDKAGALAEFKARGLYDDGSAAVRRAVIAVAGEVGKPDELEWLIKKRGATNNGEGVAIWDAIRAILLRQQAAVIVSWADRMAADEAGDAQVLELLGAAVSKAEGENNAEVLKQAKEKLRVRQISGYLKATDAGKVAEVLALRLGEGDMDGSDAIAGLVEGYVAGQGGIEAKKKLIEVLVGMQVATERPKWGELLRGWQEKVNPTPKIEPVPVTAEPAVEEVKVETPKEVEKKVEGQ